MNRKEFTDYNEVEKFVNSLVDEKKWAIDLRQNTKTGAYLVCWIEHKTYTAHDGKVYHDEVWTNEAGNLTCVQDLDPEHAKNILRMLLRNEREQRAIVQAALEQIAATEIDPQDDDVVESAGTHTLH